MFKILQNACYESVGRPLAGTHAVVHGTGLWLENSSFNIPVEEVLRYGSPSHDDEYRGVVLY